MKFAKLVFLVAGIYGLIVVLPQYFLESKVGVDSPPPITHPEFYYGFIGVTAAWQPPALAGYIPNYDRSSGSASKARSTLGYMLARAPRVEPPQGQCLKGDLI